MEPLTVLTVDDEEHFHAGLDAIVDWAALGYRRIAMALNGDDALCLVERERPDVILVDIRMPGMDGLELVRRVRAMPGYMPELIIVSGYDEFDYARQAIRYRVLDFLLKPIDEGELEDLLAAVRERRAAERRSPSEFFRAALVRRLLSSPPPQQLVTDALGALGAAAAADCFCFALAVPFDEQNRVLPADSLDIGERGFWLYQEENDTTGLLLARAAADGTPYELWAKGLFKRIGERVDCGLCLIVGPLVPSLREAWQSRQAVLDFMADTYVLDSAGFTLASAACASPPVRQHRLGGLRDALMQALESDSAAELDKLLTDAFELLRGRKVSGREVSDWLNSLRVELQKTLEELDGMVPHQVAILALPTAEAVPLPRIERVVRDAFAVAMQEIRNIRQLGRTGLVQLMKRRIERAYAGDLSLADLAAEYGMNAIYLGQLFRKALGLGFKDYLRSCRIRAARKLLMGTDLKIPEIAASVGYRDVEFFTEQFKRETGKTPAAYRGSLKNE